MDEDDDEENSSLGFSLSSGGDGDAGGGEDDSDDIADEFDPPVEFTYERYQECYSQINTTLDKMATWIVNDLLARIPRDPRGVHFPHWRVNRLWDKWIEFFLVYDTLMSDSMALTTHVDRTITVCQGAYAFTNMMQMHFARTFPLMFKSRERLAELFEEHQDDRYLGEIEDLPGGWGRPENLDTKWEHANELDGEPRDLRIYQIRVVHLGHLYDGWITKLTQAEYEEDEKLRQMLHEDYVAMRMQQDPALERENIGIYLGKERLCLPYWKRVTSYTQHEVMRAIKLLTRDIDRIVPTERLRDFLDALMYANSLFFVESCSEKMLDDPECRDHVEVADGEWAYIFNRRYMTFTYSYFWPVLRRFFFWDLYTDVGNQFEPVFRASRRHDHKDIRWLLKRGETRFGDRFANRRRADDVVGVTSAEIAAVRAWITETVLPGLGDEGFNALYEECVEHAYRCPGDLQMFEFIHPDNPSNTAAVLRDIRPEDQSISSELFQEYEVSLGLITRGVGVNYMSDIFSMWAIGRYWESLVRSDMDWKETFVIEADDVNKATATIEMSTRPLLVQLFGTYHVMVEGRAYRPASILEAITLWFKLVDRWFAGSLEWEVKSGGRFVPRIDISQRIQEIFHPKPRYADKGTKLGERPLK